MAWWAVYCFDESEFKVRDRLERDGIETYLPYERHFLASGAQGRGRKKYVDESVFPGYLFASATPGRVESIKNTLGVITVVSNVGRPLEVTDKVMAALRGLARSADGLMFAKDAARLSQGFRFAVGDRFKFSIDSAFAGFLGVLHSIERLDDTGSVIALVEGMGGTRPVTVHHTALRPILGSVAPA